MRDRTYREVVDGDYLTQKQYKTMAISLCVTHFLFEFMYLWLGCIPMVIINVVSIFSYIVSYIYLQRGKTFTTVYIMLSEVFFHAIFASIFLGMACGFQLWLFGTLASVFLPFYIPDLARKQKKQILVFSAFIIATFIVLTVMNNMGLFLTYYNVDPAIAKVMYCCNACLGFGAIIFYTSIYNFRLAYKNLELQRAADHDFLTGIYNRQRIQKILDAEIQRENEQSHENSLSVAIADIDFFKKINDTYGHLVGDDALKELTSIFSGKLDSGLLYGRWGGEEFLLIAPENMPFSKFTDMLEEIRKQVEGNEFESGGHNVKFTISIGAASYEKGMTAEQLVNLADDKLYNAKETGRNKIVY
ncbi:MAG: GGDEF domain-containing protein [Butyrivibrio sp.]|nr:GGDEF domain-containing protein [Butyrivibrio sp.]